MSIDTKPNLSSGKFEQCVGDILNLSGCTQVFGTFDVQKTGAIDSCGGYRISGVTLFNAGDVISAVKVGQNTCAIGVNNVSLGANSCATGAAGAIAIGGNARATGTTSIVIGSTACANAYGVSIGYIANAACNRTIALGICACAMYFDATAIGGYSCAIGGTSIAIGCNSVSCTSAIAIGNNAKATGSTAAISIGCNSRSTSTNSIAFGNTTIATANLSIAIGCSAQAITNPNSIAIGALTTASGNTSVALGYNSKATAIYSTVLGGYNSCATNICTVVIGAGSCATGVDSIAIGANIWATSTGGIGLGAGMIVSGSCAVGIGTGGCSYGANTVAIGTQAKAITCGSIAIGYRAGYNVTAGRDLIYIGCQAGVSSGTGAYNIGIGSQSLCGNTSGTYNTAVGHFSSRGNVSGTYNTAVGSNALYCSTGNSYNVAIGASAGFLVTGDSNVFIGNCAGCASLGSNKLYIENSGANCSNALIYGEFDTDVLKLNACTYIKNIGVGSCNDSVLTWDSTTCAIRRVPYFSGGTSPSGGGTGERISKCITQANHGFAVKDVIGWSGGTYNKAIADGTYDGEVLGIVTKCYGPNAFELTQSGYVTGLTGLVASTTYFLSDVTAGLLTSTEPTGDTHISKTVMVADTTTSGWVLPYPGYFLTTGCTGGGGVWGTITGTLSDQTDLQSALDAKLDATGLTYTLNSPSTCTVGGITSGTVLTGKTVMCLLQDILAPYIAPTFSAFDFNVTSPIEVGAALSGLKTFTWTTTTSGNVCSNTIGICEVGGSLLGSGLANDGSEALNIGTKTNTSPTTWTWQVSGRSTQGNGFCRCVSKCSIYPYYYGKLTSGSRPAVTNALVTGGSKIIASSTSTVTVTFSSSSSEYTWLAIPSTSTSKTCWYVNALDNGLINSGDPGDKYPDECLISITSGQGCWSSINYKVYMSGAVGEVSTIQFRNS